MRRPLRTGHGTSLCRPSVEIGLESERGIIGWGEAAPLEAFGTESEAVCLRALRAAAGALKGRPLPRTIRETEALLASCTFLRAAPAARYGVELALLDALARVEQRPLAALLSDAPTWTLPLSALVDEVGAEAAVAAGHRCLKLKVVPRDLPGVARRLGNVRRAVGDGVALRIDCNGSLREAEACSFLRALEPLHLELCEQPLAAQDLDAARRLARLVPCTLAADESFSRRALRSQLLAEKGSSPFETIVVKPAVLGGLLRSLRLARRCVELGMSTYVTSVLEGPIGTAGAAHLAAALAPGGPPPGLLTETLHQARSRGLCVSKGMLVLDRDVPGHGVSDATGRRPRRRTIECPLATAAAAASTDAVALSTPEGTWTYRQLDRRVAALARGLRTKGLKAEDRWGLLAVSPVALMSGLVVAARTRTTWVPLNPRLSSLELEAQCATLGLRAVFADAPNRSKLAIGSAFEALSSETGPASADSWDLDRPLIVLATSGTTGVPKGVELGAEALRWMARTSGALLDVREGEVVLSCVPLFHIGGLVAALRALFARATFTAFTAFDSAQVNSALDAGVAHLSVVPTMLRRILSGRAERFPRNVRSCLVGGGPVAPDLLRIARARGLPVLHTYGLTEACSQVTVERSSEADGQSAGRPLPGCDVRIVDAEGRTLASNRVGEIEVRSPGLLSRYLGGPVAPFRDGWFRTGDLGALDRAGRLVPRGRRTDLIVRGGENVYPAEVEAVLNAHPDVSEAVVVGQEDAEWGQVPVALCVAGAAFRPERVLSFCRERLARFKVPARFVALAKLPRTPSGKVNRALLQAQVNRQQSSEEEAVETCIGPG